MTEIIKLSIFWQERKNQIINHMFRLLIEGDYDKIWLFVGNMKMRSNCIPGNLVTV